MSQEFQAQPLEILGPLMLAQHIAFMRSGCAKHLDDSLSARSLLTKKFTSWQELVGFVEVCML